METSLEVLYTEHLRILNSLRTTFRRFYIDKIYWDERLNMLLGARGSGKTTLLLQHIKEKFGSSDEALYISMDDMMVTPFKLIEIAEFHYQRGGTHLFVDEIHKYENWSQELKNINDRYKSMKVVVSGSSILDLNQGKADLSRRAVEWELPGLSFREFLNIESGNQFSAYSLDEIVNNHIDIAGEIISKVKPLEYFRSYLEYGYYPFYLEGKKSYLKKLNAVLNVTLEVDLPLLLGVEARKISVLKKLIYILTINAPFTPNISKLSASIGIDRSSLYRYLHYLEKASIIKLVWKKGKSYSIMAKPDKLFLNNTNLYYLSNSTVNTGSLRESFFVSQLSYEHTISLPAKGDFYIDDCYLFEVGGKNKGYEQIANIENSYVAADNIMIGSRNTIPLWLFGFLY